MSLISLLIGATIGILLTGAAGKVYLDSRIAFSANEVVAATMENGRFAIDDLRRTLMMTGRLLRADNLPFGDPDDPGKAKLQLLDDQDPGASDKIVVFYGSNTGCDDSDTDANRCQLDCLGNQINKNNTTPYRARIEFHLSGSRELRCSVDGGQPEPLASGIETFQVLYGWDTDGDRYPNLYVNATEAAANGLWSPKGRIVALRIGVLASSADMTLPQAARTEGEKAFDVLDVKYTVSPPSGSSKLDKYYRVYTSTISLRNLEAVEQ
ncbi:PilW family protein [Allochromatium vinosum]|uniref:Type IV pilus assembly protein PilW n=1 Tax=Allochromatium vinosum (strain ATCC 17899 / DSM 180 / NBRC 103801 / NCIMB 10441 / D) TaxID=572477 RepID=D3RRK6_ALLVD|nr:PilW family protein [Allochromatium vinosum]ADC63918.1 hypothetical protein Alvin_3018 [Allochromatium vinosum DSM 180]